MPSTRQRVSGTQVLPLVHILSRLGQIVRRIELGWVELVMIIGSVIIVPTSTATCHIVRRLAEKAAAVPASPLLRRCFKPRCGRRFRALYEARRRLIFLLDDDCGFHLLLICAHEVIIVGIVQYLNLKIVFHD